MPGTCRICAEPASILDSRLCIACWRNSQKTEWKLCWIDRRVCQAGPCSKCSVFQDKVGQGKIVTIR